MRLLPLARQLARERVLTRERPLQFPRVARIHSGQPVQVDGVIRRDPDIAPHPRNALGQASADGKRVRTTPRSTHNRKAPKPELIRDRGYVTDAVHHTTTAMTTGERVAGPVIGDDANTKAHPARQHTHAIRQCYPDEAAHRDKEGNAPRATSRSARRRRRHCSFHAFQSGSGGCAG